MSITDVLIMLGAMLIVSIMHNVVEAIKQKLDERAASKFVDRKRNEQPPEAKGK